MKKRILIFVLLLSLCLSLVACGGNGGGEKPAKVGQLTEKAPDPNSVEGQLYALGFRMDDFLFGDSDYMEADNSTDFTLYSTATLAEVQEMAFEAVKRASDDGKVRDYWTEEPIEFTADEEGFMVFYGYYRNGTFCYLAVSQTWAADENGLAQYFLQF